MAGRNTMAIWLTKTIWLLSMVAYVISAPAGAYQQQQSPLITSDSQVTVVSQTAPSSQYHAQDELGQYSYGYTNADGQSKAEVKGIDGSIAGKYSYIDANGKKVEVSYVADDNGFRAVGDHLPSHDMTPPQYLQQTSGSVKKEPTKKDKEENDDEGKKTSGGSEEGGEEEEEGEEAEDEEEEEEGEGEEKEEEEEGGGEQEQEKESEKSPEVVVKKQQQQQLPVYTVQQSLSYAGQPTTLYRVSNVPMTIQTSSATGQSRPQLVYVARAVHLAQPSINQYLQPTKSHVANVLQQQHHHLHQPQQQQQQPLVNQYILATRTPLVSERQESAPKVATIAATMKPAPLAPTFQLIQPAPIRADQHSFHTYVPALPSPQPFQIGKQSKAKSGKSHKAPTAIAMVHQQHQAVPVVQQQQQQQLGTHASQYFPQMALLPGYGYIPAQYSVFQ